jgi:hypothetical protein
MAVTGMMSVLIISCLQYAVESSARLPDRRHEIVNKFFMKVPGSDLVTFGFDCLFSH